MSDETKRLGAAIHHLHAFAATFLPDEPADEESGLTAEDLNLVLSAAERVHQAGERQD